MRRELVQTPAPVDAIAIGASAGGIDALLALLGGLAPPWRAAVVVVLHLAADRDSRLPEVLGQRLGGHVEEARPGAPVAPGRLYLAPPGYHLLVEQSRTFALSCDPPVLFSRPSIDVLLESCADAYGAALAALVLTGASEDGARGLAAVKAAGGLALAQDPDEAAHPLMPGAAIAAADPDAVLPLAELKALLQGLLTP
ncbi:chemotaxis protein CheB [Ramlibacter tataouinensis]|uniref:chemotaxis protein CheB n=1 Tax=Ramlibacter tataouinensis TaxID=94132 RepID=UPI0022F3ED3C|nr:chemotaxis protein CheB [Ramlibacter tataouinensis]WBY03111.1 chemotaxis protein CheB [Ramlibacter tataouinensis]